MGVRSRIAAEKCGEHHRAHLNQPQTTSATIDADIVLLAVSRYERIYDEAYGGFGGAPKFPTPHNLLFLLAYYE